MVSDGRVRGAPFILLLAVAAFVCLGAAVARAEPPTLISYAGDGGVHYASSGFDTGFSKPSELFLRVRVKPNKVIDIDYQVACRKQQRRKTKNGSIRTRSNSHIPLPIPLADAGGCLIYAFGTYKNKRFDRRVHFRIALFGRDRAAPSG